MTRNVATITVVVISLLLPIAALAQDVPCSACGPGDHWIDTCQTGQDQIADNGALIGIDTTLDCQADTSLVMMSCSGSPLIITRSDPRDDSANFPGQSAADSHLDVIDTEIVSLCLTGGGLTLVAGLGQGQGGVLGQSLGTIVESSSDPKTANSFFDVFFEVDLGQGNYAYNQTALRISIDINCVPPQAEYIHPTGCLQLFSSPIAGQGTNVANLVSAEHHVYLSAQSTCCLTDGQCLLTTQSQCEDQGGTIHPGADCSTTGACCLSDGTCSVITAECCADLGGTYKGNQTDCISTTCDAVVPPTTTPTTPTPPCGTGAAGGATAALLCTILGWGAMKSRRTRRW